MKTMLMAGLMLIAAATPATAATTEKSFTTTGSMRDNGTYGNSLTISATTDATLQMKVTGWQSNQSANPTLSNNITSAYVGAYDQGLGVTGVNDNGGAGAYHQVDNAFGYTDFLLLQFNRAVTLKGANLNVFQMNNVSGKDSDFAFYNASILASSLWNSAIDLTAYDTVPTTWTTVSGSGASGPIAMTPTTAASTKWLIGAAFDSGKNDGFKISSLQVTEQVPAVPEPATWAMMLIGFGAVGVALRRRLRKSEEKFTAKVRAIASGEVA